MTIGERIIHPVHAFGVCEAIDSVTGACSVKLDNGEIVSTIASEWFSALVLDRAVLDVKSLTDEELDNELARYQSLRVEGVAKRRVRSEEKPKRLGLHELIALSENDPDLAKILREKGLIK